MRKGFRITLCLCGLLSLSVAAQDKKPLAEEFPTINPPTCAYTQRDWQGKEDWLVRCKLAVSKSNPEGQAREIITLFDLELAMPRPASYMEASKQVDIWLHKKVPEILKRNGYLKEKEKK